MFTLNNTFLFINFEICCNFVKIQQDICTLFTLYLVFSHTRTLNTLHELVFLLCLLYVAFVYGSQQKKQCPATFLLPTPSPRTFSHHATCIMHHICGSFPVLSTHLIVYSSSQVVTPGGQYHGLVISNTIFIK